MKFFKKKNVEETVSCDCDNHTTKKETNVDNKECYVKVLGSGCDKCNILSKNTTEALEQLNMDSCIQKVTDFTEIAKFGVMSTPALVLGNDVVSTGKVLTVEEVKDLLVKK